MSYRLDNGEGSRVLLELCSKTCRDLTFCEIFLRSLKSLIQTERKSEARMHIYRSDCCS